MTVSEYDTNLRRGRALLRQTADVVNDLLRRRLEPGGDTAGVWNRGGADAFAFAVHATHDGLEFVARVGERKRGSGELIVCEIDVGCEVDGGGCAAKVLRLCACAGGFGFRRTLGTSGKLGISLRS